MENEILFFSVFLVVIFGILLFDLGVFNKSKHEIPFKEALLWTSIWFALSMLFYVFLRYYAHLIHGIESIADIQRINELYEHKIKLSGTDFVADLKKYNSVVSFQYLTGYFIEYSLSMDNLFVILLIFQSFSIEKKYYKTVLTWGILGAVVMRFAFIFLGAALIHQFHWILYIFGAILIFSGIKMLWGLIRKKETEDTISPSEHGLVRFVSKFISIFPKNVNGRLSFKHKRDGKFYITPLLVVLLIIEFSDLLFAMDSVPAIFSITLDPYIIFFSNIFAILGLRSLFFLLARVVGLFHLLGYGLSVLLVFIGCKLIFDHWFEHIGITPNISLIIILCILLVSIVASVIIPSKQNKTEDVQDSKA